MQLRKLHALNFFLNILGLLIFTYLFKHLVVLDTLVNHVSHLIDFREVS